MAVSLNRRNNWTVPPASQYSQNQDNHTQIKCMLRGTWRVMHYTARWANTPDRQRFYSSWIRDQINNLPCQTCIGHAKNYVREHPPEGEDPQIWTWKFHNAVNKRLNKPEMEWQTYTEQYSHNRACTSCGH